MCEFCSRGPNYNHNRDSTRIEFAGYFSPEAIEAVVQQANLQRTRGGGNNDNAEDLGDDDTDGT